MAHALMSTAILDAMKDEIRARMGSQFKTVEDYGGQFDEEEVSSKSFVAPAAFTTCLGWRKSPASGKYLGSKYVWEARFAVFIVTKSATRPQRCATRWSAPKCCHACSSHGSIRNAPVDPKG